MAAALLALLLAAAPAWGNPRGAGGRGGQGPEQGAQGAYERLRDAFPENDAPVVSLLNMLGGSGRQLTREQFVAEYSRAMRFLREAQESGRHVNGYAPGNRPIRPEQWALIARLGAQAYDESAAGRDPTLNPRLVTTDAPQPGTQERMLARFGTELRDGPLLSESARLAMERGDAGAARQRYDEAVQNGDVRPDTLAGQAAAAFQGGDYAAARDSAQAALEADPGHKGAAAVLKLTEGRAPGSVRTSALGGFGGRGVAGLSSAGDSVAASRGGRREPVPGMRTEASVRAAAALAPAGSAMKLRDYGEAERLATRSLDADPSHVPAWLLRSAARQGLGRREEALGDAMRAAELAPAEPAARAGRLNALLSTRRYVEALGDADWLSAREPFNAGAHASRGRALAGLRRRPEALEALRRAAELDGVHRPAYEAALQAPEDADLALLFETGAPAEAAPSPEPRGALPARAAAAGGGLLLLLAALLVLVPRARETLRRTLSRRPPQLRPSK